MNWLSHRRGTSMAFLIARAALCIFLVLSGQSLLANVAVSSKSSKLLLLSLNTGVSKQKISFVSSFSGWDAGQFELLETANGVYELSLPMPWVPEFYYKFVIDGKWSHDPENKSKDPDGFGGYNSIFVTGFQENSKLNAPKQAWLKRDLKIKTKTGISREVTVLYPPFTLKTSVPTIYFNDGGDYLSKANIANFLANYFEQTGRALVAVLVSPIARESEYGVYQKNNLDTFIANDVVPNIESLMLTGGTSKKRMIIGPSLGGLSSVRTGFVTSLFGFVASQSGAFWYIDKNLEALVKNRVNTPNIYLTYGFYEGEGIVDSNKKLKTLLDSQGISYQMLETPTRHDWISWRNQLETLIDWFVQNQ